MKILFSALFSVMILCTYGQADYRVSLQKAKALFASERKLTQEQLDQFDYQQIVSLLENAIKLNPQSAEAHYYLGYTYSRMNSRDGRSMISMNLDLLYKTSAALEKVNMLSPRYHYPLIALDPYSKIGAEWGSMAMSYWHNHKKDSAIWAFREGKKRGGFGDYLLDINREVLSSCEPNAILISSGDNFSIPLWFLQIVEKQRLDVTVIDVSLLNTNWYPSWLAQANSVRFNQPQAVIDTLDYRLWNDSVITADSFQWTVKPSYYKQYVLRGDRVLLSLLEENKFQRPVYFTVAFGADGQLSLTEHLIKRAWVDQVATDKSMKFNHESYVSAITKLLELSTKINKNSRDQLSLFDYFRYEILQKIDQHLDNNDKTSARQLMLLLDRFADEKKFVYQQPGGKAYHESIRAKL